MNTKEALKHKHTVFEALLNKKRKEFDELSEFQEGQLESINESKELESHDIIENQTENQMREVRLENMSIDKLREEINYLEGFESLKRRERVEVGSLVKTNNGNFIVAVPELKFEADGEKFSGISSKSPIYEVLEGAKEGDQIEFNGQSFKIEMVA